ncbi:GpE family phage tail protein [Hydrogenovibrio sp. 3SP14C1]|nr:GpE family phage tail protein [Hydrogenovibrio sp. 3SP14C1]MDG4811653.1 GpE family phage tail protein [Hydrogenovibrio sp. 3SP14C1]
MDAMAVVASVLHFSPRDFDEMPLEELMEWFDRAQHLLKLRSGTE